MKVQPKVDDSEMMTDRNLAEYSAPKKVDYLVLRTGKNLAQKKVDYLVLRTA